MDCNVVQDKLLDYIDGNLSEEEEKEIEDHLENCAECSKEYAEMKSTVGYIKDKSNKIDTNKVLNLDPNRLKRRFVGRLTRIGLIAAILSLILVAAAFATEILDFTKWWKKNSEKRLSAWEELIEKGVGQKLNISATDKNIRVTAEGVIADDINTIILLKIEDLKGNTRFVPVRDISNDSSLIVGGDITKKYEGAPISYEIIYLPLYTEDDNTVKLMVYTSPMSKDEGEIEIHIDELVSYLNESEESVERITGNWNLTIPAEKIKAKHYPIDKAIDLGGNELTIERITIAPTVTKIYYKLNVYNEENKRFIDDVSFIIKHGNKTYGQSELTLGGAMEYKSSGVVRREFDIESIYLEDPKDIDLIVNTCKYTIKGLEEYDIDWANLPQVVEYDNSKITIEEVKYSEDSTEVIIKEDDSKDRKYIRTNICLNIGDVMFNALQQRVKTNYSFYGKPLEYEVRDSKGKVNAKKDWTDETHMFVFKQKITINKDDFDRQDLYENSFKKHTIPGKLCIEGQEYIEFPNIKININSGK